MKILILEDEKRIAIYLEKLVREIFGKKLKQLGIRSNLEAGRSFLKQHEIEVLLLDLNLNGSDGFELLKEFSAGSFFTIVISAYRDEAVRAFEFGVVDFVPKPFSKARLEKAFTRLEERDFSFSKMRYIAVKKGGRVQLIRIEEICYVKADRHYSWVFLKNGKKEFCDKSLDKLYLLLPPNFDRIHRSYLVNFNEVKSLKKSKSSVFQILMSDNTLLPIGRSRQKVIRERMII